MGKYIKTFNELYETLEHIDWNEFAKLAAAVYEELPVLDKDAVKHWEELNRSNHIFYKRLTSNIKVEFINEPNLKGDIYPDQDTMKKEVKETGVLKISAYPPANHPFFSQDDLLIMRAVHDYIIHIEGDNPFGLKGEMRAANNHMRLLPKMARPALFTEYVGQVSWSIVHNKFPVQKVALMEGFDYEHIGKILDGFEIHHKHLRATQ